MIILVLLVGHQSGEDIPALVVLKALHGRGQKETDRRALVLPRHHGPLLEHRIGHPLVFRDQLDGPGPDILGLVIEKRGQHDIAQPPHQLQGPHRPQAPCRIGMTIEDPPQSCQGGRLDPARQGALLQEPTGLPHVPLVGMEMHLDQLLVRQPGKIHPHRKLGLAPADPPDAPGLAMEYLAPADVGVVPVDGIDRSVRTDLHVEAQPLRIVRHAELFTVAGGVAGTLALDVIDQHPVQVDIAHEELLTVLLRELVREVETRPSMGGSVPMIRDGLDIIVDVGIEMFASLPVVATSLDHMEEVRNDTGGHKGLTVLVKVETPRIARAPGEDLELLVEGMIAPDPGIDALAFAVGCAGPAHVRVGEDPVGAVEPAVRSPEETVEGLVTVLPSPSIELDLRLAIGNVVAVAVRNKEQVRR